MSTTSTITDTGITTMQLNASTGAGIRVKRNSSNKAVIAAIGETGSGITIDGGAADARVAVRMHTAPGQHCGQCSEAIAVGDLVYTAANGQISKTSGGGAVLLGTATTATSNAGEMVSYDPSRT